jgi:sodium/proline symporter
MALFSKRTTWKSALAGMITGAVVCVLWKEVGLGAQMYEIVPGFIANYLVIIILNSIIPQQDTAVVREYESVMESMQ